MGVSFAVGAAAIVGLSTNLIGLNIAAERSDVISVDRQVRVAERAIAAVIDDLPVSQVPFAVWDDMVLKTRGKPDVPWFMANVGGQSAFAYPGAKTYVVDKRDRLLYSYDRGRSLTTEQFEARRSELQSFIDAARGKLIPEDSRHSRLFGVGEPPQPTGHKEKRQVEYVVFAAHLGLFEGKPAAVSVMRIVPTERKIEQRRGEEPLLITVRFLNLKFLQALSKRNLIDNPSITLGSAQQGDARAVVRLKGLRGQVIGNLSWDPERPGTRLLEELRPYAITSIVFLLGAMSALAFVLFRTLRKLARREATARRDAQHDELTGLLNRAGFKQSFDAILSDPSLGPIALLFVDLDHFKQVNDDHGHSSGDAVLREFARRALDEVGEAGVVGRLGGDEFGIVLTRLTDEELQRKSGAIIAAARKPFNLAEATVSISASVGAVIVRNGDGSAESLLQAADRKMFEAKARGRDTKRVSVPEAQS